MQLKIKPGVPTLTTPLIKAHAVNANFTCFQTDFDKLWSRLEYILIVKISEVENNWTNHVVYSHCNSLCE